MSTEGLSDETMASLGALRDARLTHECALLEWKRLIETDTPLTFERKLLMVVVGEADAISFLKYGAARSGAPFESIKDAMVATLIKTTGNP